MKIRFQKIEQSLCNAMEPTVEVLIVENFDVRQIGLEAPEVVIVRKFSALTLKRFG